MTGSAAEHVTSDPRSRPSATGFDHSGELRLLPAPGAIMMFSGAQLHRTIPNTSGISRFSIDFRTVNLRHVELDLGAYLRDSACTGTALRDFLRVVRALIPVLRTGPGDIVLINSTQGVTAAAGVGLFAAGQHATRALPDAVHHELFADGIRVLVAHAGRTATPRQQRILQTEGRPWTPDVLLHVDDIADTVVSALRLPRRAEVSELTILPMWKAP